MDIFIYIRALLALGAVLLAIALMAWGLKKWTLKGLPFPCHSKRLKINEILFLDSKHKLILVQRDTVEYLVLLSPNQGKIIDLSKDHASPLSPQS